ncbi:hypothetical protein N7481_005252 [Penicillium waksmanii]|uniref:uncharacterized protein n=1 Tax=Penicillium waksmanii TaxID=69791 RepID=UPI002549B1A4|nr:uncharacterized protein N7481_005252 [Penicillium waksmanii]KAJ5983153.1 hypothetical protein N7481_005252 [Penicillium waksmanii]
MYVVHRHPVGNPNQGIRQGEIQPWETKQRLGYLDKNSMEVAIQVLRSHNVLDSSLQGPDGKNLMYKPLTARRHTRDL